jgi:hypothetical protein
MINRQRLLRTAALVASLAALPSVASAQISPNKINNFEDGTTQGWLINLLGLGTPPPQTFPANIPTGGPAGVNDNFLQLTSTGVGGGPPGGAGGRLMALNPGGWAGNWLAAGIISIRFNAINLGQNPLSLRFLVEDAMGGPPTNIAASATAIPLAVGSGWQTLEFPLFGPNGLAALLGSTTAALSNVTVVRIYSSPTFVAEPPPIAAQLGIDNLAAVAVPEPSTVLLVGMGALGLLAVRRRTKGR